MKRSLYILPAIAILAACNKETVPVPADSDEPVIRTISLTVGADNGASKATYDDENDFAAMWEDGDQILALKGMHSQSNTATDSASKLDMISEYGGKEAKFSSDEFKTSTSSEDSAYWYFAYPADAAAMSASVTRTWEWEFKYAYSNTVSVTIPDTQTGLKWIPYMFAATTEKLKDDDSKSVEFQTLSACLAIKLVAAEGGNIPLKVKSVKIESDQNNLYGTFSRIVNDLDTKITLDETFYTGAGNTFLAEYDGGGTDCKEFRFNIPAKIQSGNLTVTIVDDKGRTVTRYVGSKAVDPGHKRNLKFAWEPESSFVDVTFNEVTANTTYSYYQASKRENANDLEKANDLENANNLENRLKAICTADVTIEGVDNLDVLYKFSVDNAAPVNATISGNVFKYDFEGLPLGEHSLVAIAVVNGKEYKSNPVTFHITGLPFSGDLNNSNERGFWSPNNLKWDNGGCQLGDGGTEELYLNSIYIPAEINFDASISGSLKRAGSQRNPRVTITANIGNKLDSRETSNDYTVTNKWENFSMNLSGEFSETQETPVKFTKSGLAASCAVVKVVTIKYR